MDFWTQTPSIYSSMVSMVSSIHLCSQAAFPLCSVWTPILLDFVSANIKACFPFLGKQSLTVRYPNHLYWLLSLLQSSTPTLNHRPVTELITFSLRADLLWRELISCSWSYSFGNYLQLVVICEGSNDNFEDNHQLYLGTWSPLEAEIHPLS